MKRLCSLLLAAVLVLGCFVSQAAPVRGAELTASNPMIELIKEMEGYRSKPYWDNGQWCIGYGTRCPDDKLEEYQQTGITPAQAQALLEEKIAGFSASVLRFADKHGLVLAQHEFDALVSFCYNCGTAWLEDTSGYLNAALRKGGTNTELLYGMCLYSLAGESYVLLKRRLCEANMYINGTYRAYNSATHPYPDSFRWVYLDANGGKTSYAICAFDATEKQPIRVGFREIPTGVDDRGNPFVYRLEGWYTDSGRKVEVLDASLSREQILHARWLDPQGNVAQLPTGRVIEPMTITVTSTTVNLRSGPGTQYAKLGSLAQNTRLTLTEYFDMLGTLWGKTDRGWLSLAYTDYDRVRPVVHKWGTVTQNGVNYRTEPVLENANKVGQKNKGDRVKILEETYSDSLYWGKMADGNWICLSYVLYDEDRPAAKAELLQLPEKTLYFQGAKTLDTEGSVLLVTDADGNVEALSLTRAMLTNWDTQTLGQTTVTAAYKGCTVTYPIQVVKEYSTITFCNSDGSVLSTGQYAYGATVTPPPAPKPPVGSEPGLLFKGWDKEITACIDDAVYTAVYELDTKGDTNLDGLVTEDDAIYLLLNVLFGEEMYPVEVPCDFDGNGTVAEDDAIYLLLHVLFGGEMYPLQ